MPPFHLRPLRKWPFIISLGGHGLEGRKHQTGISVFVYSSDSKSCFALVACGLYKQLESQATTCVFLGCLSTPRPQSLERELGPSRHDEPEERAPKSFPHNAETVDGQHHTSSFPLLTHTHLQTSLLPFLGCTELQVPPICPAAAAKSQGCSGIPGVLSPRMVLCDF